MLPWLSLYVDWSIVAGMCAAATILGSVWLTNRREQRDVQSDRLRLETLESLVEAIGGTQKRRRQILQDLDARLKELEK